MPPISKPESYLVPFDLDNMIYWVQDGGGSFLSRRPNATFSCNPIYSSKHSKSPYSASKIDSDSIINHSFSSKSSAFTPVKLSSQSYTRNSYTEEKHHSKGNAQLSVETSRPISSLHSRNHSALKVQTLEYHFKTVISPAEEIITLKYKERQRLPFEEIEIYPQDEDLVTELSFDMDGYEYDMDNTCRYDGILSSESLIAESDKIVKRALELTSRTREMTLEPSHLDKMKCTESSQTNNDNSPEQHHPWGNIPEKDNLLCKYISNSYGNKYDDSIRKRANQTGNFSNEIDCRDDENLLEDDKTDTISISSSIQVYNRSERKSTLPPLKTVFIYADSNIKSVESELSKDGSDQSEINADSMKSRQILLQERIEKIKSRGRKKYMENNLSFNVQQVM